MLQAAKLLNFSFYEVVTIKAYKRVLSLIADTLFKLIDAQKLQAITETMPSTNDAADLVQLQSELDQLTVQQEAVMEEWAELSEQVE